MGDIGNVLIIGLVALGVAAVVLVLIPFILIALKNLVSDVASFVNTLIIGGLIGLVPLMCGLATPKRKVPGIIGGLVCFAIYFITKNVILTMIVSLMFTFFIVKKKKVKAAPVQESVQEQDPETEEATELVTEPETESAIESTVESVIEAVTEAAQEPVAAE